MLTWTGLKTGKNTKRGKINVLKWDICDQMSISYFMKRQQIFNSEFTRARIEAISNMRNFGDITTRPN